MPFSGDTRAGAGPTHATASVCGKPDKDVPPVPHAPFQIAVTAAASGLMRHAWHARASAGQTSSTASGDVQGRPTESATIAGFLSANRPGTLPAAAPKALSMASNLHDLPDSPCIGVCSTLFDEVCKGCGRTAMEVSNWVFLSDEEKRAVWARIEREGTAMRFQKDRA